MSLVRLNTAPGSVLHHSRSTPRTPPPRPHAAQPALPRPRPSSPPPPAAASTPPPIAPPSPLIRISSAGARARGYRKERVVQYRACGWTPRPVGGARPRPALSPGPLPRARLPHRRGGGEGRIEGGAVSKGKEPGGTGSRKARGKGARGALPKVRARRRRRRRRPRLASPGDAPQRCPPLGGSGPPGGGAARARRARPLPAPRRHARRRRRGGRPRRSPLAPPGARPRAPRARALTPGSASTPFRTRWWGRPWRRPPPPRAAPRSRAPCWTRRSPGSP
jgi:hypothetical protein